MQLLVTIPLIIVGIIHLLPVSGVLGVARLEALYGIPFAGPDLEILMRHRAILFGLLGLSLIYAAFHPDLQRIAILAGVVSTVSFVWLAWSIGGYNALIGRVVLADLVAIVCLITAIFGHIVAANQLS